MTAPDEKKAEFLAALREAIDGQSFIRLTLGKFRGSDEPSKAVATLILLKGTPYLKLVSSLPRKDVTKTFVISEGIDHIGRLIGETYMSATLFSTSRDLTLTYSRKGVPHLVTGKPKLKAAGPAAHDRAKTYLVASDRPYLKALQVADAEGRIKPSMQGKYRQICRFIEIVDELLKDIRLADAVPVSIVDIGSGKGYLTFALYDHLVTKLGRRCRMTGIEVRGDLVELCNRLARELRFDDLSFEASVACKISHRPADIVIALHACDTATDDAMAFGVKAEAKLILAAPCCQHEIAPQIKNAAEGLTGLIKYPLFKQRQADLVTDAARALLLEASGYKVKVIEFVATEHTAKNILIAAIRSEHANRKLARQQYLALKREVGFSSHHLEAQLKEF